jgi:hypothetical protein
MRVQQVPISICNRHRSAQVVQLAVLVGTTAGPREVALIGILKAHLQTLAA